MSELIKHAAFYLFARPTFFSGMGRIFDFTSSLNEYNESKTPSEADAKALYLDWLAVGQDLQSAFDEYEQHIVNI